MTLTHVLCPVDGSDASARALPTAIAIAHRLDLQLTVLSCVSDEQDRQSRRSSIASQLRQLAPCDIGAKVDVVVAQDVPATLVARAGHGGLVVMATTTRLHLTAGQLGSATEQVIRTLKRPVVTVGPDVEVAVDELDGVVVACDGSPLSELALPVGREWADRLGVPLTVVSVLAPTAGDDPAEGNYVRNLAADHDASWEVLHGDDVAETLSTYAGSQLIVMTSHGRTGWSRFRYGSVATATTRLASVPVVKVCPPEEVASVTAVPRVPVAMSDLDYPAGVP